MQNLNASMQTATGAIAVGLALETVGNAALASFASSDEGYVVSDFAVESLIAIIKSITLKDVFPVVIFEKGDKVKVIAEPLSGQNKYTYVSAIIDKNN